MRRITFDIETEGDFKNQADKDALKVTVVGIHDSDTNEYRAFLRDELKDLWPILERADILVGYNSDHFDIPILGRYYAGDLTKIKSVDLMKEVKDVLGRRLRLDNLAQATLGKGKIGHGLEAIQWWKEGKFDKVREYCLDDVRITNELYLHAKKHGSLKYKDYDGVREIKLDTSLWEALPANTPALTHTLPF
jgi:hypothetical protein